MRFKLISFALVVASLVSANKSTAQTSSNNYIEFEKPLTADNFKVETFGELGTVLTYEDRQDCALCTGLEFTIELYDKSFEKVLEEKFQYDVRKVKDIETVKSDLAVHVIVLYYSGEFNIHTLSIDKKKIESIEGTFGSKKFYIWETEVLDDNVIIKTANSVLALNVKKGTYKFFDTSFAGTEEITQIRGIQKFNDEKLLIYFHRKNKGGIADFYAMEINKNAELVKEFKLFDNPQRYIVSAKGTDLGNGKYAFVGTYNNKVKYQDHKEEKHDANGIFYAVYKGEPITDVTYYNFTNFENFNKYLDEYRQGKIEKFKEKNAGKGKEYNLKYLMTYHPLIVAEDGFYFVGEAFLATYRSQRTSDGGSVNVFDGYDHTHGIVCKFDNDGEIVWNQGFDMKLQFKPFNQNALLLFKYNERGFKFIFSKGNQVNTLSIDNNGDIYKEKQTEELATTENVISCGDDSSVNKWDNNYYLASGEVFDVKRSGLRFKRLTQKFYFFKL